MASWLHRQASSHQAQITATALLSGVAVAGIIFGVQAIQRQVAVNDLKASIPNINEAHPAETVPDYGIATKHSSSRKDDERAAALARRAQQGDYDQELIDEQLTRTSTFLTPDGLSKLRSAFVVIVGLGGVGSHCTTALVRSGVSRIRVVDFDQVTLSSLNRHAVATLADVGTPKVSCVRKRLEAITPWVKWECFNEVWQTSQADRLLGGWDGGNGKRPDFVVDAIDNIDSKVALLKYCREQKLRVISSMGTGCKSDPTRVFIGDISASMEDPLSRSTRRRLKMLGVHEGVTVVYSIEKPGAGKAELLPLPEEEFRKGKVGELSVLPDFRARILPVIGTMPAVFGYVAANFVIMELTGYPHEVSGGKGREKMYENILQNLQALEERLAKGEGEDVRGLRIAVTREDVGYLVEEVFRGKSVISGLPTRLALARWRPPEIGYKLDSRFSGQKSSRLRLADLVCMTKDEAIAHEERVLKGKMMPEDVYEAGVVQLVDTRLGEQAAYEKHR